MALTVLRSTFHHGGLGVYVCVYVFSLLQYLKKNHFFMHIHVALFCHLWKHYYRPLQVFETTLFS